MISETVNIVSIMPSGDYRCKAVRTGGDFR